MIRIGILGGGTVAGFQAPGLSRIPSIEFGGWWDPERERADRMAQRWGGRVYDSEDALLGDDALDAVLVMSPTPFHRAQVVRALESGRHVFCEKPIARTVADAEAMLAAAAKAPGVFMVGQVLRFFHEFEKAHKFMTDGTLGRVGMVRTTRAAGFPRGWKDWYAERDKSGGVVVDMVVHDFDFLRWTLGPVERVFARTAERPGDVLFDYVLTVLRFESGTVAHVEASWAHAPGTFFTRLEAAGTAALLSFDSRQSTPLRIAKRGAAGPAAGVAVPESPVAVSPYQREMEHFVAMIEGRERPLMQPEEALEALRIGLAARQSAETGAVVRPQEVR